MSPRQSVLIVDESEETREVLRTALEHRGLRILEATGEGQGLALAREHQPDLVVVDLEARPGAPPGGPAHWARQSLDHPSRFIVLGSLRAQAREIPGGQFVRKPYHYAPLIRKIEELLAQAQQPA